MDVCVQYERNPHNICSGNENADRRTADRTAEATPRLEQVGKGMKSGNIR